MLAHLLLRRYVPLMREVVACRYEVRPVRRRCRWSGTFPNGNSWSPGSSWSSMA